MRKNTIHQIYRFQPWGRTRRAAIAARGTKTTVIIIEKITATIRTATMVEEATVDAVGIIAMMGSAATVETAATIGTAAIVGTVATAARASKIFRKSAIIAVKKETATMAARVSKKGGAVSFNRREKYICINGNAMVFA